MKIILDDLQTETSEIYPFMQPDTEDTIIKEEFGRHGRPLMKQGTLIKIIERLTNTRFRGNDLGFLLTQLQSLTSSMNSC